MRHVKECDLVSWQATAWADSLPHKVCGELAYRVLIKYANVADQRGQRAWRTKAEIADELGVHARSVERALRELEGLGLIERGDQRLVSHLRGDRRPTVYDLNMRWTEQFATPELALGDDAEHGATWLSTDPDGATTAVADGATTAVAQGTIHRTTRASTPTGDSTREQRDEVIHQTCPRSPRHGEHDFASGNCARCGIRPDQRWQGHDIVQLDDLLEAAHA